MRSVGLIPVRLGSSRLPGKALKDICGLPAIVHVYKRSTMAKRLDDVFVVTDSDEIREAVESFGGQVMMTGAHRNGSERIYEASQRLDCDYIINIQGDEVLVYPDHIDRIAGAVIDDPSVDFSIGVTRYTKVACPQDFKGVLDLQGNLMYCSREDIPSSSVSGEDARLKVVFIVGYTKASLAQFVHWSETELERREPNEFLRILQHGGRIRAVEVDDAKISLDTPSDLEEIRRIMQEDELVTCYLPGR